MRGMAAVHALNMKSHRVTVVSIGIGRTISIWPLIREWRISKSSVHLERTVEFLDRTSPILYRLN